MGHYRGRGETAGLQHKDTFREPDSGSYRGAIIQDSILPPPTAPSVYPKLLGSKKKSRPTVYCTLRPMEFERKSTECINKQQYPLLQYKVSFYCFIELLAFSLSFFLFLFCNMEKWTLARFNVGKHTLEDQMDSMNTHSLTSWVMERRAWWPDGFWGNTHDNKLELGNKHYLNSLIKQPSKSLKDGRKQKQTLNPDMFSPSFVFKSYKTICNTAKKWCPTLSLDVEKSLQMDKSWLLSAKNVCMFFFPNKAVKNPN